MEPAKLTKLVRGELDWIAMKALEKDRNRRYETANGFAMDVQRYLADEPVAAGPPSTWYRLRKLVRRNRAFVIAGALLLLTLLVGVAGTSVGLLEAKRSETHAIDESNKKEVALENLKEEQGKTKSALTVAASGRKRAREALDELSSDVIGDWLSRQPKLTAQQKKVLERTLARYEEFTREAGDTPEQRRHLAQAYWRVADFRAQLGMRAESRVAYERSIELYQAIIKESSGVPEFHAALAKIYLNRSASQQKFGELENSLTSCIAARVLLEQLVGENAENVDYAIDLGGIYSNIGRIELDKANPYAALEWYDQAIARLEPISRRTDPKLWLARDYLSRTLSGKAAALAKVGKLDEAMVSLKAGRSLREQLAREEPDAPYHLEELGASHHFQGSLSLQAKIPKKQEALQCFREACAHYEPLVRHYPGVPQYVKRLAAAYYDIAGIHEGLRQPLEALKCYELELPLRKRLVQFHDGNPEDIANLARTHGCIGYVQTQLRMTNEATKAYKTELDLLEKLIQIDPLDLKHKEMLGGTYCNLASIARDSNELEASLEWFKKAIATLEPLTREKSPPRRSRLFLRNSYYGRCVAYGKLRRYKESIEDLERAIALDDSGDPHYRVVRAQTLAFLGEHKKATAAAEELAEAKGLPAVAVYNLARVYSLCVPLADKDDNIPSADRNHLSEKHAARAVVLLRRAFEAGFGNVSSMKKDRALDPLRQREDFKKLLAELESKTKK
jgi:tetratricopeptide (TPR) repeat protein